MLEERRFSSALSPDNYFNYYCRPCQGKGKQPLLIYLHGAGSRGSFLSQMGRVAVLGELDHGREIPGTVVAPQCHLDTWFDDLALLCEFIDFCRTQPEVDQDRVYLCGLSMGGYGAWQVAITHPDWFAALVPVCGGGMYWNAYRLKALPIWAFHGALDTVVLPEETIHMVKAVNQSGGNAKMTIYPDVEHNAWEGAFADDALWAWLYAQKRTDKESYFTIAHKGDAYG